MKDTEIIRGKYAGLIGLIKDQERKCVILDIDGCLADSEMSHLYGREIARGDFKWFHDNLQKFKPFKWARTFSQAFYKRQTIDLVFLTARNEDYKKVTEWWLKVHLGIQIDNARSFLFMRPNTDYRSSVDLKKDYWNEVISQIWSPLFALDDRKNVIEMWMEFGVPAFHTQDPSSKYMNMVIETKDFGKKDICYDVENKQFYFYFDHMTGIVPDREEVVIINEIEWTVTNFSKVGYGPVRCEISLNKDVSIDEFGRVFENLPNEGGQMYVCKVKLERDDDA